MLCYSCKNERSIPQILDLAIPHDSTLNLIPEGLIDFDTSQWLEITPENSGITMDIRYATTNNFTEAQIYDCGRCFLRPEMARKIVLLNQEIKDKYGLSFKLFDCYRPKPSQEKLWFMMPDPNYVTPPEKGSMHNRGLAVDITLIYEDGEELDMGTEYDFFGVEAHTDNMDLPEHVLKNRELLKNMVEEIGLSGIRTEWWHFSYSGMEASISDWVWNCP